MSDVARKVREREYATQALKAALERKNFDLARLALQKGANIDAIVFGNITPLAWAINQVDIDRVRFLLSEGADPYAKKGHGYSSAFDIIEGRSNSDYKDSVMEEILNVLPDVKKSGQKASADFEKAAGKGTQKKVAVPKKAVFKNKNDNDDKKAFRR